MTQLILAISTVLAVVGAYLNSVQSIYGFYIWIFTNFVFMIYNYINDEYALTILFMVYLFISANGVLNMWNNKK